MSEMRSLVSSFLAGVCLFMATFQSDAGQSDAGERQITHDSAYDHLLDNNDNFSPDDRFLVFDTRTPVGIHESALIAKVEIATGKITPLYRPEHANAFGPGVAAASFAHHRNEVIFIHGPLHPTGPDNQYEKHCRLGMIVRGDGSGEWRFADARNVKPPFTVGALRGGTHRHEFSGDDQWVGFTYNDAVVRAHGLTIGKNLDLRTIGVTKLGHPVQVAEAGQFSNEGAGFSALVVVVTPDPRPGTDEISCAAFDSWVGLTGYRRADGKRQRARAFIGTTRNKKGHPLDELFIVDIPEDVTVPGPLGPLQGTETTFPMPPAGTSQRRLTHTETRCLSWLPGNRPQLARRRANRVSPPRRQRTVADLFDLTARRSAAASDVCRRWRRYGRPLASIGGQNRLHRREPDSHHRRSARAAFRSEHRPFRPRSGPLRTRLEQRRQNARLQSHHQDGRQGRDSDLRRERRGEP